MTRWNWCASSSSRTVAILRARPGCKCGLSLHQFAEAQGRLIIFYDQYEGKWPSDETRFNFEEFVLAHVQRRALNDTVELVRFFVFANGRHPPRKAGLQMRPLSASIRRSARSINNLLRSIRREMAKRR